MSKFDRVDVGTLAQCCIGAIHARAEQARDRDVIACPECRTRLVFADRIWRPEHTTLEQAPPGSVRHGKWKGSEK